MVFKLKQTAFCTFVLLTLLAVSTTAFALPGTLVPHVRTYAWEIAPAPLVFANQDYKIGISSNFGDKFQMTWTISGGTWFGNTIGNTTGFTDASIGNAPGSTCNVSPTNAPGVDYQVSLRPLSGSPTTVVFDVTDVNPGGVPSLPPGSPGSNCIFRLNANGISKFLFNSSAVGALTRIQVDLRDEFQSPPALVDTASQIDLGLVGEAATMTFAAYSSTIDAINYDNLGPSQFQNIFFPGPLPLSRFVQGATPTYACNTGGIILPGDLPDHGGGLAANYTGPQGSPVTGTIPNIAALGFIPSTAGTNDCPLIARAVVNTGNSFLHVMGTDGQTQYVLAGPPNPDLVMFTLTSSVTTTFDDVLSICLDLNGNGIGESTNSTATNECFTKTAGSAVATLTVNGNRLGAPAGSIMPVNLSIVAGKNSALTQDQEIQGRTMTLTAQVQRAIDGAIRSFGPNSPVEFEGTSVNAGNPNPTPFWTFQYNGTKLISNMATFNQDLTGATGVVFKLRFTNLSGTPVKIIVTQNSVVPDPAAGVPAGSITVNAGVGTGNPGQPGNTVTGYTVPAMSSIQVPFNTNVGFGETGPTFATISPFVPARTTVTVIAGTALNNILGEVLMPTLQTGVNTLALYPMSATDGVNSTLFYRFQ